MGLAVGLVVITFQFKASGRRLWDALGLKRSRPSSRLSAVRIEGRPFSSVFPKNRRPPGPKARPARRKTVQGLGMISAWKLAG